MQKDAEFFLEGAETTTSIRDRLSAEEKSLYDEMKRAKTKQQRWSDGLVFYHSLETESFKCPMNAVADIFMLTGSLCLLGLAKKHPIRGAIEISWGVELHNNELYGAVVANSYELESKIAQYPRIVVSENTVKYLTAYINEKTDAQDKLSLYNKSLATLRLNMTAIDQDGHHILDYLGPHFKDSVLKIESKDLYDQAYSFICEQYDTHSKSKNSKLAIRYTWLKGYFHQNKNIHKK